MRYKIETQDDTGIWTDVRGSDGTILVYTEENAARAKGRVSSSRSSWMLTRSKATLAKARP